MHRQIAAVYVPWLRRELLAALRRQGLTAADADLDLPPKDRALAALQEVRRKLAASPPRPPSLREVGVEVIDKANASAKVATAWASGRRTGTLESIALSATESTAARLAAWTAEASGYIVALPTEAIDRLERIVVKRFTAGTRVETIAREFETQLGVTDRHARLLARDQTAKLNATVIREDFTAAGIDEYVWTTADDERVREDHAILDGQTFRWDDPPIADQRTGQRGHPGEVFQCRCVALPVVVRNAA